METEPTQTSSQEYDLRATSGPLVDPYQDSGQEVELEPTPVRVCREAEDSDSSTGALLANMVCDFGKL